MIRLARALPVAAVLVLLLAQPVLAGGDDSHLAGGGTATISQVAFNVAISDSGTASGTFTCLMAGRSAFVLPAFGLAHIMKIQATPTAQMTPRTVNTQTAGARTPHKTGMESNAPGKAMMAIAWTGWTG